MATLQIQVDDNFLALWQKIQMKYQGKSQSEIFYQLIMADLDDDWEKWDNQIITDSKNPNSKLNQVANQALQDLLVGNFTELRNI